MACALDQDAALDRLDEWRALLTYVTDREQVPGGLRLHFGVGASAEAVERLAIAEHECCSFFAFEVSLIDDRVSLQVTAPAEAQPIVADLFGEPDGGISEGRT